MDNVDVPLLSVSSPASLSTLPLVSLTAGILPPVSVSLSTETALLSPKKSSLISQKVIHVHPGVIGRGAFGTVSAGHDKDHKQYALKFISNSNKRQRATDLLKLLP